ncbi:nitrogen fixation protein NifZ [Blastopirellula sp. JC732]|uniref:Nitrogen fixation protein NifZ n=1 Tax=Blastopirellula sediminis TaxID=2894196 RepID=A0A9X1ML27_9BACT|nr:nitrogen fixation protein NifZ [Blastopirellula sediminis]MCC9608402.1 nitrogen fixation protein NifZ [Blastopirellula sediminis]MCC9628821.1 nitrogen fixation protein NifZ [Blastopirellula sediminis]
MKPRYEFGERVRVTRTVRNDGTFPGMETGTKLVTAGSSGFVRNVGTFLQDQIIYTVHFVEEDLLVGCREEELIPADEVWVETQFEFRDHVITKHRLAIGEELVAEAGSEGEVVKVLRNAPGGPAYHVYLRGRTFQIPETALLPK